MNIKSYIWYEKYRPKELDDLILSPDHRKAFSKYIEDGEIPHLLLHGPPGSGKTTLANILMDKIKCNRLVLNASSEDRGIGTVKGKVKQFASSMPISGQIKIIFLDEADQLTPDAQKALRNTMETYSQTSRFILTGNYLDKILPEIQSRCIMFEFSSYSKKRLLRKLLEILNLENVHLEDKEGLSNLIEKLYPDIRKIINALQMCSMGGEFNPKLSFVLNIDFNDFSGLLSQGKFRSIRKMLSGINDFLFLYKFLFDIFIPGLSNPENQAKSALTVSEYLYRDSIVVDREINFSACCLALILDLDFPLEFNG